MSAGLSAADRQQVQALLDDFAGSWSEQALMARAKKLPPAGNPLRLPTLLGLVQIDIEKQWQGGRKPTVEGFLYFYPELGTRDSLPVELIHAEYRARQRFGGGANLADFRRRFPNQAEALVRLVDSAGKPATAAASAPASADQTRSTIEVLPAPFGRYRVLKIIGRGGMGTVYLAEDPSANNRRVALKITHANADGEVLQRFQREAKLAGSLSHPNLCPVLDSGHVGGLHYLTLAYIDGPTLADVLKRGPMQPRQAVELVRKLATALQTAHAQGIIHRDLKPANIMLDRGGEPYVMDFGLARRDSDVRATVSGQMLGTPAYMPPEQVMGDVEGMGPACDIYSLGMLLYELVTGGLPFRGDIGLIMKQVLNKIPEPPSEVHAGLDPRLDPVVLRALAKDPAQRYPSMAAFATALADFLVGRVGEGSVLLETDMTRSGRLRLMPTPRSRRSRPRWLIPAAILAAVLLTSGLVGMVVFNLQTDRGSIVIQVEDPKATVQLDGKDLPIKDGTSGTLQLDLGTHKLLVKRGGAVEVQEFSVRKGKNGPVKAKLPPIEEETVTEEKWVRIFNGKDLTGWKFTEGGNKTQWAVNDGVLQTATQGPGWLMTDKTYSDFELKLEYRVAWQAASGISLRAPASGNPSEDGIEIQIIDMSHHPNVVASEQHGALLGVVAPKVQAAKGVGEWNALLVVLKGRKLTARLNDKVILDVQLDNLSAYYKSHPGLRNLKGRIALECDRGVVGFRNLEVKELGSAGPKR